VAIKSPPAVDKSDPTRNKKKPFYTKPTYFRLYGLIAVGVTIGWALSAVPGVPALAALTLGLGGPLAWRLVRTKTAKNRWRIFGDVLQAGLPLVALAASARNGDGDAALAILLGLGLATLLVHGLKRVFYGSSWGERPKGLKKQGSFPSAHTTGAFAGATALLVTGGWAVGTPALGVAALVGWTRIRVGKHFPRDVMAGALVGAVGMGLGFSVIALGG
jgi:membrane-associated phospholipid phosphatase